MASKTNQNMSPEKYIRERARGLEIGRCYWIEGWEDCGITIVFVSRRHKQGTYTVGAYQLDTFCLGVKDTFFAFNIDEYEYQDLLNNYPFLTEVSYNEAHNLIYAALEFAEEAGIHPHKSWDITKYILEEDDQNIPLIEYVMGKEGEYFLCASDKSELDRYLPILRRNLGRDVKSVLNLYGAPVNMDDTDEDIEEDLSEQFMETMAELNRMREHLVEEECILPEIPYMEEPELNHPGLLDLLEDYELSRKDVKDVLSLPHETLRHDLESIIRYQFDPDNSEWCTNGTLNAIFFLAEVGNEDSLDVILDSLRMMDKDYKETYFGYASEFCYVPTLAKLGKDHLDKLESFMHEANHYWGARAHVMHAVVEIAYHYKEKWDESVAWFRRLLAFYCDALPKCEACDSFSASFAVYSVMDLKEESLLDDMLKLLDTDMVDDCFFRERDDMIEEVINSTVPYAIGELDIYKRYKHLKKMLA